MPSLARTVRQPEPMRARLRRRYLAAAAVSVAAVGTSAPLFAVTLADRPLFTTVAVPGNVLLSLSVEWPTANTPAYPSTTVYSAATAFIGYFDPNKCYRYVYDSTAPSNSHFTPHSLSPSRSCTSTASAPLWSGNFLNWASTHTLDAFRATLTGGLRVVDTATDSIVEKTRHSGQGDTVTTWPDKVLSAGVEMATPFTWSSLTARVFGLGVQMVVIPSGVPHVPGDTVDYVNQSSTAGTAEPKAYRLNMRVRVCDSTVGLEDNCVLYASGYKPEGLLQQYASTLRFSVFGYLNDADPYRDGGVMRSRMKFIGPKMPVEGAPPVPNPAAEWDAASGIMKTNPDPADAMDTATDFGLSASDVPNSGVMNYVNKFGATGGYKEYDPTGELYYAGLRYFKHQEPVAPYTSVAGLGITDRRRMADGFPVITRWDDPIRHGCERNFVLGIGDVDTHYDTNLPGSVLNSAPAREPSMPPQVSGDGTINVKTATDMVGRLEGLADLGSTRTGNLGRDGSNYIAGLAYDAHTVDQRPDLPGKQTIDTFWLDVMENQIYRPRNQYWLASKYGGFEVPADFLPFSPSNSPATLPDSTWWRSGDKIGGDKRPDNYFAADRADRMRQSLTAAFRRIASLAGAATGTAFATPTARVAISGTSSYSSSYDAKTWTGQVIGSTAAYDPVTGTPSYTPVWSAQALLDAAAATDRRIVTCCRITGTGPGLPFRAAALSTTPLHTRTYYASFNNVPGASTQSAANFVAYLRGERSQELAQGGAYRNRAHLLGDIVGAKLTVVGAPSSPYTDATNPGYAAFAKRMHTRETVVYAGSNDGMLHAFGGDTRAGSLTGGHELFAYVPSFVYGDASTAGVSGLASLGNPAFIHHFLVDGTALAFDIDMQKTAGAPTGSHDWRTVLIGGLGKGGRGYYALDITDPASWTSEANVETKVMWEFTDPRMGYSFGEPSVVKTRKHGWVAIFTSGYSNSDGKGYFFIVNPRTGELLEALATPEGSPHAPLDMAHHAAFVNNFGDHTADAVYAGDLRGNLWRLDLTPASGIYASPTKIATLTTPTGEPQPVTTRPLVEVDPGSSKRYVLVGTGRLLDDADLSSTQRQSFYAILDGTRKSFFTASTLPSVGSFPVTRKQLNANTSLIDGIGTSPAYPMGWYLDLAADAATGVAERVTVAPTVNVGIIGVSLNLPKGSTCSPEGSNREFAVTFADGKSVLQTETGASQAFTTPGAGVATDIAFQNVSGRTRLIVGDSRSNVVSLKGRFTGVGGLKQLNWREVPIAD